MPHSPLQPGVLILDRSQSIAQAEQTAQLLDAHLDHGPDNVRMQAWAWKHAGLLIVTTAN